MSRTNATPHIAVERREGGVLVARIATHELGLIVRDEAGELVRLIRDADADPGVHAVVFTGSHAQRFVAHADLAWLQEDGSVIPPVGRQVAGVVSRIARLLGRFAPLRALARRTPMTGAVQLDEVHAALTRMTTSSTIFVAALNGSVLGLGAELSWACDLRLMADGDHVIGHPEILLGFPPGAGGTQRLPRLIGRHRALVAILEGRPFSPAEALEVGAVDEVVPADRLLDRAIERARFLASRPASAIAGVKRAVNVGGSLSMAAGIQVERAEFLAALPRREAQEIMKHYLRATAEHGELPLYRPGGYAAALERGDAAVEPPTAVTPKARP